MRRSWAFMGLSVTGLPMRLALAPCFTASVNQRLLVPFPVRFNINDHPGLLFGLFGQNLGHQILQGLQRLTLLADEQTGIFPFNNQIDLIELLKALDRAGFTHFLKQLR